jgi:hypothetical protein
MELILAKIQMLKVEKDSATNFDTNTSEYEHDMIESHHRVEGLKDQESDVVEEVAD